MAQVKYSIRKMTSYELETHEGLKRVDVWTNDKEIELEVDDEIVEKAKAVGYAPSTGDSYEGTGHIMVSMGPGSPQSVPHEIRFPIEGVSSVEEAFHKYNEAAEAHMEKLQKKQEEMMAEAQSQIVTPEQFQMP